MGTKRTPIDRSHRTPITPRAVELWELMRQFTCTCEPRDWDGRYWEHEPCPGCEERNLLRRALHQELKLKPWEITIRDPDAPNPWPAGSFAAKGWAPDPDAVERWRALAAASRERRRAS